MTDQALNDHTRRVWNENAPFWDQRMGDGNDFQQRLVGPSTERLLNLMPDEQVLEIACGNGVMARRLAELGAFMVATDFAETMIERARSRGDGGDRIRYRVIDATDRNALLALRGEARNVQGFDAVVCNMALMDMADISPLMHAIPNLLRPDGRFVFTQTHPCFNSSGCERVVEERDTGKIDVRHSVKVWQYATSGPCEGLAMHGQPRAQLYFNRTLTEIITTCLLAGLVIDGIEEPVFPKGEINWIHGDLFAEIPPVLSLRLKVRNSGGASIP
jgi:2-polyprenyl-3-methyl-5-hydroxy-6-metoxy-1,4-benzoquinol methylase